MIHCILIYDIIRLLVNGFNELDIELLLLLLRSTYQMIGINVLTPFCNSASGPQLRSDDPAALKEIILLVQEQASNRGIKLESSSAEDRNTYSLSSLFLNSMKKQQKRAVNSFQQELDSCCRQSMISKTINRF